GGGQVCGTSRRLAIDDRPAALVGDQRLVFGASDIDEVGVDYALGIAMARYTSLVQPQRLVAEPRHHIERVRDEQHGLPTPAELGELVQTLVGERFVADRQHFVDAQYVRVDVDRDREPETHVHA